MIHDINTIKAKEPQTLRQFLAECHKENKAVKRQIVCCEDVSTGEEVKFEKYKKVKS